MLVATLLCRDSGACDTEAGPTWHYLYCSAFPVRRSSLSTARDWTMRRMLPLVILVFLPVITVNHVWGLTGHTLSSYQPVSTLAGGALLLPKREVTHELVDRCRHPYMWRSQVCYLDDTGNMDYSEAICELKQPETIRYRNVYDDHGNVVDQAPDPDHTTYRPNPSLNQWPPTPEQPTFLHGRPWPREQMDPVMRIPKYKYRHKRCPNDHVCVNYHRDREGHQRTTCVPWKMESTHSGRTWYPPPR